MNILLLGWHKNKQNSFVLKIHTLQCSLISEPQAVLNSKLNLNQGEYDLDIKTENWILTTSWIIY